MRTLRIRAKMNQHRRHNNHLLKPRKREMAFRTTLLCRDSYLETLPSRESAPSQGNAPRPVGTEHRSGFSSSSKLQWWIGPELSTATHSSNRTQHDK